MSKKYPSRSIWSPLNTARDTKGRTEHTWRFKLLSCLFNLSGLARYYSVSDHYSRAIFCFHFCIYFLQWVFCLQQVFGIFFSLARNDFTLKKLLSYCLFVFLTICIIVKAHALLFKGEDVVKCLRDSLNARLHCTEEISGSIARRKYARVHNTLLTGSLIMYPGAGLMVGVISPSVRFLIKRTKSSYVLRAIWYPVDVMSSSTWFWCALVYESILVFHTIYILTSSDVLYLYLVISTRAKFDTLCQYLIEKITVSPAVDQSTEAIGIDSLTTPVEELAKGRHIFMVNQRSTDNDEMYLDGKLKKFKQGIDDWNVLWRQSKLIHSTFARVASVNVICGAVELSMMSYLAVTEMHAAGGVAKNIASVTAFAFYLTASSIVMFNVSYGATLLERAHEDIRYALCGFNWSGKHREMQRVFTLFHLPLNRPLTMKAFGFYRINVETFSQNMIQAVSYITFLLQLSRMK